MRSDHVKSVCEFIGTAVGECRAQLYADGRYLSRRWFVAGVKKLLAGDVFLPGGIAQASNGLLVGKNTD